MKRFDSSPLFSVFVAVLAIVAFSSTGYALEASISGQINHMVMWADDGENSDFFITDNDNSGTRFRFKGVQDMDWGKFGFRIEFDAQRNASNTLSIAGEGEATDDGNFEIKDRWLEGYFDTTFGKISLGKGDGAANGTTEVDLSGTKVAQYANVQGTAASFSFIDSDTRQKITTVKKTRNNFDGLSRNERLRYDTPSFGGANLAASITNGNAWELAGFWDGEFGDGHKVAVAAGYLDAQDREEPTDTYTQWGASASYLMPFGLNLSAAYGTRNFDEDGKEDATNYYFKLGYKIGIHAFSAEYSMTENLEQKDDESSNWGLAYVVKPWKGVELYAAGRVYSLDRTDAELEDISQIYAGTRIKF